MDAGLDFIAQQFLTGSDTVARLLQGRTEYFAGFEAVNVDRYGEDLLLILYQPQQPDWLRRFAQGWQSRCPEFTGQILIQHRYRQDCVVTRCVDGWDDGQPFHDVRTVTELGLRYEVELGRTQNTGFFPDMVEGRRWLQDYARDRRVLNLFAYTCSFGVVAAAHGATEVLSVDMSAGVLKRGQRNHELNDQAGARARILRADILRSWPRLRKEGAFDTIVVDPPTNQGRSFRAQKHYPRVARQVAHLCEPGADVLFCLNAPFVRRDEFQHWIERCGWWDPVTRVPNPDSLPELDPEKGLKVLHYRRRAELHPEAVSDDRD